MPIAATRWLALTPSEFPWEREARDYVRERLSDHELSRAWTSFEFIADDGSINEVDLPILTPAGFFLRRRGPGQIQQLVGVS